MPLGGGELEGHVGEGDADLGEDDAGSGGEGAEGGEERVAEGQELFFGELLEVVGDLSGRGSGGVSGWARVRSTRRRTDLVAERLGGKEFRLYGCVRSKEDHL